MSTSMLFAIDVHRRRPAGADHPERHILAALADEVANGLIVCDGDGLLHYANRSARAELDQGTALRLVDDIVALAAGPQTPLKLALQDASRRGRRRMLAVGSGRERLVALTMPLQPDADDPDNDVAAGTAATLVVVMLGRRGTCSALGIEMLATLHGLTLAECRVLRALLDGDSPNRIALTQGVAVSTVRTHVKSIRDKLGVRSVEGLFIRAAEVPPITSALRCSTAGRPTTPSRGLATQAALVAVPA